MNKFKHMTFLCMQHLTNFPYIEEDFDALTNYELLCKVVEYLNKVIANENEQNDTINNLIDAYLDLKNIIDNLDFQEEVNTKLDEMAEDGTLSTLLQSITGIEKTYDTALEMIDDENLIAGMYVRTLGYSTINDGGGSLYYISDTADNFYVILDNLLYANLVLKNNEINLNALGADYTGTNDTSSLLNSVLSTINNLWLLDNFKINTVVLTGKYLLNDTVSIPPCTRLRGNGFVEILFNGTNKSAFHITYLSQNQPNGFSGNKQDWNFAELLNFEKGCVIKNINETSNVKNTGIEIGTTSNLGETYCIARYKLCNFRLQNFEIGILHNIYNVYLGKYENISFETCNIGVQYGKTANQAVTNSGENMSYHNCLFSTGDTAFLWNSDGYDTVLDQCSVDFTTNVFVNKYTNGYQRIVCYGCHFEGMKENFLKDFGANSIFSITNCSFIDSNPSHIRCNYFNNCNTNSVYIMDNNKITGVITTSYDPEKLYQKAPQIKFSNSSVIGNLWTGFLKENDIFYGIWDDLEDGNYTVTPNQATTDLKNIKFEFNADIISNSFEIRTDDYLYTGHKSLVVKSNSDAVTAKNLICTTDYIDVTTVNKLYLNAFIKNIRTNPSFSVKSYDADKNEIKSESLYHNGSPSPNNLASNTWWSSAYGSVFSKIPTCKYIKITFGLGNINRDTSYPIGTEFIIGGIIGNKL